MLRSFEAQINRDDVGCRFGIIVWMVYGYQFLIQP
jgi:hypothetical protein